MEDWLVQHFVFRHLYPLHFLTVVMFLEQTRSNIERCNYVYRVNQTLAEFQTLHFSMYVPLYLWPIKCFEFWICNKLNLSKVNNTHTQCLLTWNGYVITWDTFACMKVYVCQFFLLIGLNILNNLILMRRKNWWCKTSYTDIILVPNARNRQTHSRSWYG